MISPFELVDDLAQLVGAADLVGIDTGDGDLSRWRGRAPDGSPAHFKRLRPRPDITTAPNVVAEVLTPAMLAATGIPYVAVTAIHVAREQWWLLRSPLLPSASWRPALFASAVERAAIEPAALVDLFVADVVIGNGDRNLANLMVGRDALIGQVLPVDHELALLDPLDTPRASEYHHLVPGLDGWECAGTDPYAARRRARLGTIAAIAAANPWYRALSERIDDEPEVREQAWHAARRLRSSGFEEAIAQLPDAVLGRRPDERRRRLRERLWSRAEALVRRYASAPARCA